MASNKGIDTVFEALRTFGQEDTDIMHDAAQESVRRLRLSQLKWGMVDVGVTGSTLDEAAAVALSIALQLGARQAYNPSPGEQSPMIPINKLSDNTHIPSQVELDFMVEERAMIYCHDPRDILTLAKHHDYNVGFIDEALCTYSERSDDDAFKNAMESLRAPEFNELIYPSSLSSQVQSDEKDDGAVDDGDMPTLEHDDEKSNIEEPAATAAATVPIQTYPSPPITMPEEVPEEPVDMDELCDYLFKLCDWSRNENPAEIVEPLMAKLFASPLDEPSILKYCFEQTRPYTGCEGGATLVHVICDFPPLAPFAAAYEQILEIIAGIDPPLNLDLPRDGDGHTPLFRAVSQGHFGIVKILLKKKKADPNTICQHRSLLMQALMFEGADRSLNQNYSKIASLLIHEGASIETKTLQSASTSLRQAEEGKGGEGELEFNPFFEAVRTNKPQAVNALLSKGCDPNITFQGTSPLVYAIQQSLLDIIKCLLGPNTITNLNQRSDVMTSSSQVVVHGSTAIIEALRRIHLPNGQEIFKYILAAKRASVDLNIINNEGECCASLACHNPQVLRKLDIIDMLLDHPVPCSFEHVDIGNVLLDVFKHKEQGLIRLKKYLQVGLMNPNEPNYKPLDYLISSQDPFSLKALHVLLNENNTSSSRGVICDVNMSPRSENDGPYTPKPPPLIQLVQQHLQELDNNKHSKIAHHRSSMSLIEEKLHLIAQTQNINKELTSPDLRNPGVELTAIDLVLKRHEPLLNELTNKSSKFWNHITLATKSFINIHQIKTLNELPLMNKSFGLSNIRKILNEIEKSLNELESIFPTLIENDSIKRFQMIDHFKHYCQILNHLIEKRNVWKLLHDKITRLEIGIDSPPLLAGQQWSDLRYELSYRENYFDKMDDDDIIGNVGLSQRDDFIEEISDEMPDRSHHPTVEIQPVMVAAEEESSLVSSVSTTLNVAAKEWTPGVGFMPSPTPPPGLFPSSTVLVETDSIKTSSFSTASIETVTKESSEVKEEAVQESTPAIEEESEKELYNDEEEEDDALSEDGENETDDFLLSVVPKNIGLSRYAYNWIQKSDPSLVNMALKKLILLSEGPSAWKRSRQLSKVLEGQKYTPTKFPVREAKLDRGMRILWQECSAVSEIGQSGGGENAFAAASGSVLIWYITKHDFISARLHDIDRCFMRMNVAPTSSFDAAFKGGAIGQNDLRHNSVPEVLLDPKGNTPLMVYDVMVHELPQLKNRWSPPMRLTAKEEVIVKTDGLVTIVGRSGTGKTVCVAMRMDRDAKAASFGNALQRQLRQVFIARSRALCSQVRRMVETGGHNATATTNVSFVSNQQSSRLPSSLSAESSAASLPATSDQIDEELAKPSTQFVTIDEFVRIIEDSIEYNDTILKPNWNLRNQVRWHEFEKEFWPSLNKYAQKGYGGKDEKANLKLKKKNYSSSSSLSSGGVVEENEEEKPLVPLMIWTQIRSMIKGSCEAAWGFSKDQIDVLDENDPEEIDNSTQVQPREPGTPISRLEYLGLSTGRCPLSQRQRSAAYEYFLLYQDWLIKQEKWDDMDRVLCLVKKLKSVQRGLMSSSIWKHSRVPFDRIYADEVQDATQAEITLFSLCCNDHVDGLFLAGDNAQAITHGVSFRFQELRLIMQLAAPNFNGSTKPLQLTSNYRSHSGVLEFAASMLTQLDICFPSSFMKLKADSGLSRGPRPGLWTCKHGIESLKNALKLDERLIILTRDENKQSLKAQLGQDSELKDRAVVLGICEAKGLEFNEIILVDFFASGRDHVLKGWTKLLGLNILEVNNISTAAQASTSSSSSLKSASRSEKDFVGKVSTKQKQEIARDVVPLDLEVDLKLLYTAVTRCRNRLIIAETKQTSQWSKFVKLYQNVNLATQHSLPESKDENETAEMLMPDELIDYGLKFIEQFDIRVCDVEQESFLDYGLKYFKRAGDSAQDLLKRAQVLQKHQRLWEEIKALPDNEWKHRSNLCVGAVMEMIDVGLVVEAKDLCLLASNDETTSELIHRLEELDQKWKLAAKLKSDSDVY